MKHLKRFNEDTVNEYDIDWQNILPKFLTINQNGKVVKFKMGNVMKNADMVQCTYDCSVWGFPSTLEIDFYFIKVGSKFKIDVDITVGDDMVSEFSIEQPSSVNVIEYTSHYSKYSPDSVFGFDEQSLTDLISLFNRFNGFSVKRSDFNFLDTKDNYRQS